MKRLTLLFLLIASVCFSQNSAIVKWNANTESDLDGYYVSYGTEEGNYFKHIPVDTNYLEINYVFEYGKTYYFAVRAFDFSGNISDYSSEVSYTFPNPIIPASPVISNASFDIGDKSLTVEWNKVDDNDVIGYYAMLGDKSKIYSVKVELAFSDYDNPESFIENPYHIWKNLSYDKTYYMAVSSFTISGESEPSNELQYTTSLPDTLAPSVPVGVEININIKLKTN